MNNSDKKFLKQIKKIVLEQAPTAKIYLYGSRIKRSERVDSDWDLLILLPEDEISDEEEKRITFPLYDLEFNSGQVISPMIYSEKEWNSRYKWTPIYQNIMEEGELL
jgi:predicted nucleotidyltransferase